MNLVLNYNLYELEFEYFQGYLCYQINNSEVCLYKYNLPLKEKEYKGIISLIKQQQIILSSSSSSSSSSYNNNNNNRNDNNTKEIQQQQIQREGDNNNNNNNNEEFFETDVYTELLNNSKNILKYLNISVLNPNMKIIGYCKIPLEPQLFNMNDENSLLPSSQTIWSYEFESILNNAIGVGTRNGYIRGIMYLHKIPCLQIKVPQPIPIPQEEKEEEEFEEYQSGTGSFGSTEIYLPDYSSSSSEEEIPITPKDSSEPEHNRKPLRHYITIDETQQFQTEYIPKYHPSIKKEVPQRRSINRPRWSISQSIQSNIQDSKSHLLRCVACMLRSTQCQQCNEQQVLLEKRMISDLFPDVNLPDIYSQIPVPLPPPPLPISPPSPPQISSHLSSQQPTYSNISHQKKPITQKNKQQQQPYEKKEKEKQRKQRSKLRNHPMPNVNQPSSSSRIRQHTYASAVSIKPLPNNPMNSPSRGFHFINPQPDYSKQNKKIQPRKSDLTKQPSNKSPNKQRPEIESIPTTNSSNNNLHSHDFFENNYFKSTQPIENQEYSSEDKYNMNIMINNYINGNNNHGYIYSYDEIDNNSNNMNDSDNYNNQINDKWGVEDEILYISGR